MSALHHPPGDSVTVFAPATVGNVACGFDVLGLALEAPGDRVRAWAHPEPGVRIRSITGDGGQLPRKAHRNTAGLAVLAVLELARQGGAELPGVELDLIKGLPQAGGMGGSAASAVAGALAVDTLLGLGLPRATLLQCAGRGEAEGAGAAHLDNAAPALYGGICLVLPAAAPDPAPPTVVELPVPSGLHVALVNPALRMPTADARAALGDSIPLSAAISQWGNTAGFVAALFRGDMELLARTVVDHVAEPVRASLIPGFARVRAEALGAGALAASISGAGPSLFALCPDDVTAGNAARAMVHAFQGEGVEAQGYVSPVTDRGARVVAGSPGPGASGDTSFSETASW
jgi:homoserine kinase